MKAPQGPGTRRVLQWAQSITYSMTLPSEQMDPIAGTLTIEQFGRRLRAGEITASEVVEGCLRRIDAGNPRLNAFIRVMADTARSAAAAADRELAAGRDRG